MMPVTANIIIVYQVDDTDGDRQHRPKFFLKEEDAKAYKDNNPYRSYVGERMVIEILDEDDNDSKSYFLAEDITMKMSHVNAQELRAQALSKLTRAERMALGLEK